MTFNLPSLRLSRRTVGGNGDAQIFDFSQREVTGKPAGLGLTIDLGSVLAAGKFWPLGHVSAEVQIRVVPRNQHAVFGADEVRLHRISAIVNCFSEDFKRVFRQHARSTPVSNHYRRLTAKRFEGQWR